MSAVKGVLRSAATRVDAGWCQKEQARTSTGRGTTFDDPDARSFCVAGAIAAEAKTFATRIRCYEALAESLGFSEPKDIIGWNNSRSRRRQHVVSALLTAAKGVR